MSEPWLLPVDFPSYLEAKIEIDDRSLHPRLLAAVRRRLRRSEGLRLLDLGTGTGAMIRRLLRRAPGVRGELVGLDPDRESLELAGRCIRRQLGARGYVVDVEENPGQIEVVATGGGTPAFRPGSAASEGVRVRLVPGGLLEGEAVGGLGCRSFDLVTANALLDLLPIEKALEAIRRLLRPGGWLYATINYDGLTALFPPDEEPELERRLLERYDLSMEERRAGGQSTGGRWSGRRLCRSLPGCGYAIRDAGASDWMVFPGTGGRAGGRAGARACSPGRRVFLRTLLTFMAREGLAAGGLDPAQLRRWYARRLEAVERGTLGLITHQLDVLAEAEA